MKFEKLTRTSLRALKPGQIVNEHGIYFKRLSNGDGTWSINVMVDGQRIHRVIGKESAGVTRSHVEEALEKMRTDSRTGRLNLPRGRKNALGFSEAADKYLTKLEEIGGKDIDKKRQRLKLHLKPFFGNKPLQQLSNFDLERYKKHRLDQGIKPATVNKEYAIISHMLNKALEWGWLNSIPCKPKKLKEDNIKTVFLTEQECQRLLNAALMDTNPQIHLFMLVGLHTGMRRSEILSIKLGNIDTEQKTIFIPQAKAGAREQKMTTYLSSFLEQHLETITRDQIWLFPSIGNYPSKCGHTTHIEDAFRRVVEDAGLNATQVTRHTLRHTYASHLIQAGVDLPTAQSLMGHKSPSMIYRYTHRNDAHVESALDKLENRYLDKITRELHIPQKTEKPRNAEKADGACKKGLKKWYPQGNSNLFSRISSCFIKLHYA